MRAIALILASLLMCSPAFAGGAEKDAGGLPQFDVTSFPTQVFWLFIMFGVVYVTVKNVIVPQIGGTIETREAHIKHELQLATILTEKARQSVQEYDAVIRKTRITAFETLTAAHEKVTKLFAEGEIHQHNQFVTHREDTMSKLTKQKIEIAERLEGEVKTLSSTLVQKLITANTNSKTKKAAA